MNIQIISASAGSGKTYKLATILDEQIKSKKTNPDNVIATTFTKKAAAELMERVRIRLIQAGEIEAAQRLAFARLGTINSICSQLLSDHAFELGLSPELLVLDELLASEVLKKAQSRVLGDEEARELAEIQSRLEGLGQNSFTKRISWDEHVSKIIGLARTNGIDPERLKISADRSIEEFLALLGKKMETAETFNQSLVSAMEEFIKAVPKNEDFTQKSNDVVDRVNEALRGLKENRIISWNQLGSLANKSTGKKSEDAFEPLKALLNDHHLHPWFQKDCERAIRLAFEVAGRTLTAFQAFKKEHGVIDFIDQEAKALSLLQNEKVISRLKEDIDLVLVDEFQDTSPLQLAIFMSLADMARHGSYWVGDQKQSIYAFRGTDPKLMDAAITQILAGNDPETLPHSYRSRAPLVHLTSNLFAEAFKADNLPEKRVRIEPACPDDDPKLGPVLEYWHYKGGNAEDDAASLASGIKELLNNPETLVRDPESKETRPIKGSDVAVLCKTNSHTQEVAQALDSLGIRAAIATEGLMSTPEARLVHAALRLWIDPKDRLAGEEVLRLTTYADKPNEWLERLLQKKKNTPPLIDPAIEKLIYARGQNLRLGTIEALDAVMEAAEAWEWCLKWGNSVQRQLNLEALRAHAVSFVSGKTGEAPATIVELVAHFDDLQDYELDTKATFEGEDAVVVSTWHGAKGLEWPVVILCDLQYGVKDNSLGANIVSEHESIDIQKPLEGRWIRYWPTPYHYKLKKSEFHRKLEANPVSKASKEEDERQLRRLLYVGWTRARDKVILASRSEKLTNGIINVLKSEKGCLLEQISALEKADGTIEMELAGCKTMVRIKKLIPIEESEISPTPGLGFVLPNPREYPQAWISPSQLQGIGEVGKPEVIGDRLKIPAKTDMASFGNALHGFLAADRKVFQPDKRLLMAKGLLERWGFNGLISPEILIEASNRFIQWVEKRWPGATWHRELPIMHRQPNGSTIRGNCDLAHETKDGWVVIDHKSFPGNAEEGIKRAGEYAAQLNAYAKTIEVATGKKVVGIYIHMPTIGLVVGVSQAGKLMQLE